MTEENLKAQIDAAMAYEAVHVPALFRQWATRLLDEVQLQPGDRVLDLACGTGVLAREAAFRLGGAGGVVGVDPAPGMLAAAKRLGPGIEWRAGSAEDIPLPEGAFDHVFSQFGMMFFTDPMRAVEEMHRVLAPRGHLVVAVWDRVQAFPLYDDLMQLLKSRAGDDAAAALNAPFRLGDEQQFAKLFNHPGLHMDAVKTRQGTARFANLNAVVEAELRGWLPLMGVQLDEALIESILSEAADALAQYVTAEGRVEFSSSAHMIHGRKA